MNQVSEHQAQQLPRVLIVDDSRMVRASIIKQIRASFDIREEADGEAGAWRLWVMDADGSNQRMLPIDVEMNYTFGAEQMVSWGG